MSLGFGEDHSGFVLVFVEFGVERSDTIVALCRRRVTRRAVREHFVDLSTTVDEEIFDARESVGVGGTEAVLDPERDARICGIVAQAQILGEDVAGAADRLVECLLFRLVQRGLWRCDLLAGERVHVHVVH